jgi:hypothetical protein
VDISVLGGEVVAPENNLNSPADSREHSDSDGLAVDLMRHDLQLSIRVGERNCAFNVAGRIHNANFA